MQSLRRFVRDDQAQDLIEYALVAAFVCFAALVGVRRVSAGMTDAYNGITLGVQSIGSPAPSDAANNGLRIRLAGSVSTSETCPGVRDTRTSGCPSPIAR